MRSVPEKTLEHWLSEDLRRRFPHARLWWPTSGEDVEMARSGPVVGKSLILEIKTMQANPGGSLGSYHRLEIDKAQLDEYCRKYPNQVYYAFAIPGWEGELGEPSSLHWLAGADRSDLHSMSAGSRWMGSWVGVMLAERVKLMVDAAIACMSSSGCCTGRGTALDATEQRLSR